MFVLKKKITKIILLVLLFSLGLFVTNRHVFAEDSGIQECRDNGKSVQDCPEFLKSKLILLQGQSKTLSSQIAIMDNQINLTQARIEANKRQILDLTLDIDTATKKISTLSDSLNKITEVLLNRIVATYEAGSIQPLEILLSSGNASNFLSRLNYLRIAQAHDKRLIYDVQQAKNDYTNQKDIFETQKKKVETLKSQLEAYTIQLNQEKQTKENLLAQTQGSEDNYQKLIAAAEAELAGFTSFVTAAGASFADFGTGSNGWYYTQRDSRWGGTLLPGSSSSVLLAGCAVTSVAMVCKSYGQNVTPASIVSNSSKFIYGDLWNWAFSCDGKTTTWIGSSKDQVRSYVESGTPVILRLVAPSVSGLHFIVAWKWDGNDFIIHDPYYGPDKKFSERYGWSQVTTAIAIH
jgi:peptidoglycan hydrolase CwlO-like protein